MRLFTIISILILTSCTAVVPIHESATAHRTNRAAHKLKKLTIRYPELHRVDTNRRHIQLHTPIIPGTIEKAIPESTFVFTKPAPFDVDFEDDFIKATFSLTANDYILDYEIKSIPVDTIVEFVTPIIQPERIKEVPTVMTIFQMIVLFIIGFISGYFIGYFIYKFIK